MPLRQDIKKVLVIGSGPIIIGQAAEFDYAGTQACRALKEEGLEVVLVNSNPATIMTDKAMADHVYIEPLNIDVVKRIIEIEKPDSVLSTLGGQTGLTFSMQLAKEGFLDSHNVKLLGANPLTIDKAEDRQMFKDTMEKIGEPCIPSKVVNTVEDGLAFIDQIKYPVIIRPAFTMGGTGGGIAYNEEEFREIAGNGLRLSPITQILVEKCISGWKEIEFEVIRDSKGNIITVCSMENVDPVGVHTGDSIVVAPAVTLSPAEFSMLRKAALNIVEELGVEGGCNCQFALHPTSMDYAVIEVNPRVSRSSALASKATGYPIAKVATKIAIGYTLDEIINAVTGNTYACFEPSVDYLVVKFPKWPFDKFVYAKRTLGTQMMATGEVMSIGTSFESAMMKAVRSVELGLDSFNLPKFADKTKEELLELLHNCDDERIFCVYEALKKGIPAEKILPGAAFYSRLWRDVRPPADGGYPGGLFVETDGPSDYGPGYDELLRGYIGKNGFIRYWDDAAKAPYLFDGGTFISYDDPQSLREKCRLVRQAGAAGMMAWEYGYDSSHTLLPAMERYLRADAAERE